jgi:hypothetical protein
MQCKIVKYGRGVKVVGERSDISTYEVRADSVALDDVHRFLKEFWLSSDDGYWIEPDAIVFGDRRLFAYAVVYVLARRAHLQHEDAVRAATMMDAYTAELVERSLSRVDTCSEKCRRMLLDALTKLIETYAL